MNESIPSSAQPAHAAQKPRTWFRVSGVRTRVIVVAVAICARNAFGRPIIIARMRQAALSLLIAIAAVSAAAQDTNKTAAETLLGREILIALDVELSGTAAKDHVARLAQ